MVLRLGHVFLLACVHSFPAFLKKWHPLLCFATLVANVFREKQNKITKQASKQTKAMIKIKVMPTSPSTVVLPLKLLALQLPSPAYSQLVSSHPQVLKFCSGISVFSFVPFSSNKFSLYQNCVSLLKTKTSVLSLWFSNNKERILSDAFY